MSIITNLCHYIIDLIRAKAKQIGLVEMNSLFLVIHTMLLLISCQTHSDGDKSQVFRYNSLNGISSLDPAFARTQENIRAVNQLFNGLVQMDEQLKPQPCIAKKWEIDSSGKLYIFQIRTDVFFHKHSLFKNRDDRRVKASDFVYSFNRIMNPRTASDGAWIFNGLVDSLQPFTAVNDSTLEIRLQRAFAPFPGILSMAYCYVVPKLIVEHYGKDFGRQPIGTGPFCFANWEEGIKLNFVKNKNYFESSPAQEIPKVDAVSISFIQSKQTELLEFIQGKLSAFSGLESSFKDEILRGNGTLQGKYQGQFQLLKQAFLNTEFLSFQLEDEGILSDLNLRKAIHHAINREVMIRYLRNGMGRPANGGFIPLGLSGHYTDSKAFFNPEKARSYLTLSRYQAEKHILTLSTTKDYLDLCILVQKDLERIGIKINIDVIPSGLLRQQKSSGEVNFFRGSWIADYADSENYMACFYSKNKAPMGPNYSRLSNARFDYLYENLILEKKEEKRLQYLKEMETIILESAAIIVLYYDESFWLYQNNVQNMRINALNHLDLRWVKIEA